MADRESTYVLKFDGEAGTLRSVLSALKSEFRNTVADLEATTKRVQLFGDIETKTKAASDALEAARKKAADLATELLLVREYSSGATDGLVKSLAAANREVTSATNAFNRQVDALTKQQSALTKSGVDTSNLAREQLRLAEATRVAAAAQEQAAAKQLLGFKTVGDVAPQIAKLQAAFDTLKNSGTLSAREIAVAQGQLTAKIKEVNAEVTTMRSRFGEIGSSITSGVGGLALRFLGITTAITATTVAINAALDASREFRQSLAEIGTVTNLSKSQLEALGDGARRLAVDIGFDLQAGLKALFELIRSGVPTDNALDVLAISAEAAKAALTDIGTAAKVSTLLLDGFGLEVTDLRGAFDALLQGSKDGGATLKEFAEGAGPLLNVSRALGLQFNDVVAALSVMVDASNDAQGSIAALTKIVVKLGDPSVRSQIRGLVGETTGLVDTFQKLGAKGLNLQEFLALGVASTKTAAAVSALTNNSAKLGGELDRVAKSAGNLAEINAKLYDSPQERSARFNAALHETALTFGQIAGSGSALVTQVTNILSLFNSLTARFIGTKPAADAATQALDATAAATKRAGDEAKAAAESLERAKATLTDFSAKLLASIQGLQAASGGNLAEIQARAAAEIAALDRTTAATAATAAQTIAIQQKAGADRLAEILATEARVTAAVETAVAARTKLLEASLKGDKDQATKIAGEVAKIRADAAQKELADLRSLLNDEQSLRQQHVANVNNLEQGRLAFNQGIEDQLFQLRLGGLSAFDQYVAKVQEIERLTALARKQGADGFIQLATETSQKAITLALGLGKVVNENGQTIIGKYEAQGVALNKVNEVQKNLNANIGKQEGLEKNAADALDERVQDVSSKIASLQEQVDGFKADLARNLILEIHVDDESIRTANAAIDEVARTRFADIVIRTTKEGATPPGEVPLSDQIPRGLNAGGLVIDAAQRFARGGPVFRRPAWSKVPGSGSGDTVPAALPVGSFVMRKAASQYYGDALLSRIARGFATGGTVDREPTFINFYGNEQALGKGEGAPSTAYDTFFRTFNSPQQKGDYFGDVKSGTAQSVRDVGEIGPPKLPSDPGELLRKILEYANAVVVAANPERYTFQRAIDELNDRIREYERRPDEDGLMNILRAARAIGLNLGISTGNLSGFDIDGRKWHKETAIGVGSGFSALGFSPNAASYHFYAKGGAVGGDTVPAWLTPGEYVVNRSSVSRLGTGFLDAVNSMRISREALASFAFPQPPRPPARFAAGGLVGSASATAGPSSDPLSARASGLTVNIYSQTVDEKTVYRDVIPAIRKAMKRSA